MKWNRCLAALAAVCLLVLGSADAAEPRKFATPQECFDRIQELSASGKPTEGFLCLTDIMQDYMVGNTLYLLERQVAFRAERAKVCEELLKKYKHDKTDIAGIVQIQDSPGGMGMPAGFVQLGSTIKNKQQFMEEVNAALKPSGKTDEEEKAPRAILKDLKIDGETATGTKVVGESEVPVVFRRINGTWLMAADVREADWRKSKK